MPSRFLQLVKIPLLTVVTWFFELEEIPVSLGSFSSLSKLSFCKFISVWPAIKVSFFKSKKPLENFKLSLLPDGTVLSEIIYKFLAFNNSLLILYSNWSISYNFDFLSTIFVFCSELNKFSALKSSTSEDLKLYFVSIIASVFPLVKICSVFLK